MRVVFERTGSRRYAVTVEVPGEPPRTLDPAPGFDEHIPHDLVHYVVEAELGLTSGVYGRAARGGGTFISTASSDASPRERARRQRKQRRREASLRTADEARGAHMLASERLAALCDLAWRRRHNQQPDPRRWQPENPLSATDAASVERVLARLDSLAPLWATLPAGGQLAFTWPSLVPDVRAVPPTRSQH